MGGHYTRREKFIRPRVVWYLHEKYGENRTKKRTPWSVFEYRSGIKGVLAIVDLSNDHSFLSFSPFQYTPSKNSYRFSLISSTIIKMIFFTILSTLLLAATSNASPTSAQSLIVYSPRITSPKASTTWALGSTHNITWGMVSDLRRAISDSGSND